MSLFAFGCAQTVEDIDRTQPNKVSKATFNSGQEWYYRQTVVDTDQQGSFIFEGLQSPLKRVRWVITQNTLYACSTTPTVEHEGDAPILNDDLVGESCYGIVAAFPIVDHFDVQRAYNTATGEQSNVLVENRSDRPWYDRDYMRVNWSRNMVDGLGMFGSYIGWFSSVSWDIPQDDNYVEADRARISPEYIETTSMNTFSPDIWACFDSFGDVYNCEGGLIRVRNSFVPIPEEKTFEPVMHRDREYITKANGDLLYTANVFDPSLGLQFEAECDQQTQEFMLEQNGDYGVTRCTPRTFDYFGRFGFFRTENGLFNSDRGVPEDNRLYYANHWNIWQTAYDEDGNLLDMADRKPKPIVYHLNPAYPRDMIAPAKIVEKEWDEVFKETVRLAKGYDTIEQVGDELEELYGDRRMYKIEENGCMPGQVANWLESHGDRVADDSADPRAIVNGYASGSDASGSLADQLWGLGPEVRNDMCAELEFATENRTNEGARFVWQRPGDVRYSYFYWVEEFNSFWSGYGPSSADPRTGEIISGSAHMAGTSLRMTAQYAADLVQYMNGELDPNELRYGANVLEQTRAVRRQTEDTLSQGLDAMGKREFTRRANQGMSVDSVSPTNFARAPKVDELPQELLQLGVKGVSDQAGRISRAAMAAKRQDTRFVDFMKRPEIKSLLMADPEMFTVIDALAREKTAKVRDELTEEDLELAYIDLQSPYFVGYRDEKSSKLFAEQSILTTASVMTAVESLVTYEGVAEAFKGKTSAEIQRYFMEKMFVGTQLHEVGHTVGLRHNFSSSMDAINYHDEWWKIQEMVAEGRLAPEDTSAITDRALIAEITGLEGEELAAVPYLNETEFRLGSVMDYTMDLTGRFAGLGKYDQAAINFVYGGMVQRWNDDVVRALPNGFSFELFVRDYTELPIIMSADTSSDTARRLDGIKNIVEGREWVSIKEATELARLGIESNTQNWHEGPTNPDIEPLSASNPPFQDMMVPYNFCTDDRRDAWLGCSVFDWGTNQREIVNHNFNTYRMFQDFWRWSRGNTNRYGQSINSYYGRMFRTFNMISTPFRFYSIYRIWDLGTFTDDLREAAIDSGNFFSEVLAMPQPGRFCLSDASASTSRINTNWFYDVRNTYLPANTDFSAGACSDYIDLQPGPAQFYNFDFTNEYEFRIRHVGTFIDKLIATQSLFNVSSNYLFSQFLTDSRATNVSYWTLFQDEMLGMIRGMLLNDYRTFGGMWDEKTQSYMPPRMIDRNAFTYGTPRADEDMQRIFSLLSFNHEFNAMVFAMITAGTWADRHVDFPQYLKIAVDNTEIQEYEGVELAEFVNPTTGQKYVAPQTADGKSIAYDMIEWANRLEDAWLDSEERAEQLLRDFDIKRENYDLNYNPLNCEDENLTANDQELAVVCEAQLQYDLARDTAMFRSEQLQDVVAKLDQVRYIWQALGPSALR
jgi:hypothetical protein